MFRTLFFVVFAFGGAYLAVDSVKAMRDGSAASTWPTTPGRVLAAECRYSGSRTSTPHVLYEYAVGGQHYVGERERFGIKIATRDCVAGYSSGQQVRVFYDPRAPGEAVLRPGDSQAAGFGILAGLVFFAFGAGGVAYQNWRKRQEAGHG